MRIVVTRADAHRFTLMAELALNRTVHGLLPMAGEYPEKLSRTGLRRWLQHAEFSLAHAQMRAARGDLTGTVGQTAKAVIETAHALACAGHLWVINEKKLVEQSGLQDMHARFIGTPATRPQLLTWLDELHTALKRAWPQDPFPPIGPPKRCAPSTQCKWTRL
jgi:hypothetical protein